MYKLSIIIAFLFGMFLAHFAGSAKADRIHHLAPHVRLIAKDTPCLTMQNPRKLPLKQITVVDMKKEESRKGCYFEYDNIMEIQFNIKEDNIRKYYHFKLPSSSFKQLTMVQR